jgi:hypothetical protein
MRALLFTVLALTGFGACDAYDTDLGPTPYLCGETAPRCPDGYGCQTDGLTGEEICVGDDESLSQDFSCADDSANEPNNALEEAIATPVDGTMATFSVTGQSVCPAGDRDLFAITISQMNSTIELVIEYEAGGAELQLALLNAGGVPISTGKSVSEMKLRAAAQNLPVGTYYASISAPVMETISVNNYSLSITATP